MAIKKGAFDLYTQERQLPNKKTVATNKNNHFFDDVNKTLIGSDLPQRQLTITDANFIDEINVGANKTHSDIISNGSQTVHNGFTSDSLELGSQMNKTDGEANNRVIYGSQMVHNGLTSDSLELSSPMNQTGGEQNDRAINGSQAVHNGFTCGSLELSSQMNRRDGEANNRVIYGSQMVHNGLTSDSLELSSQMNQADGEPNDRLINGSQTVHNGFTSETLELSSEMNQADGEPNDRVINGSQTVHNGFTSHTIDPLNSQVKQTETIPTELNASMEKLPKISFSRLVGNQREIIIALYKNMKINKSDATGELTLESISKLAGVNQKSLKNTLFRLSNAGLIFRSDQKIGRGGWVKYKVNPHIIREIQEKEFFRY